MDFTNRVSEPRQRPTARGTFRVVFVDPEGSGMDYAGHLGMTVTDGMRCCFNCTCIFGDLDGKGNGQIGPFIPGELEALDDAGTAILAEVIAKRDGRGAIIPSP